VTDAMWKVIVFMYRTLEDDKTPYWSVWHLEERLGIKLAGCGVPHGDDAIEQLVKLGLIEELPDLGCRYRIVVKEDS
jgi:hypothetical protein